MVSMDLRSAWGVIEHSLSRTKSTEVLDEERLLEAAHVLEQQQLGHIINEWFFETFQRELQGYIAAQFWAHFQAGIPGNVVISHICQAFAELYKQIAAYSACFERLAMIQTLLQPDIEGGHETHTEHAREHAQMLLKAIVFSHTTRYFQEAFHEFYYRAFKAFDSTDIDDLDESAEEEAEPVRCSGCDDDKDVCSCKDIIEGFHTLNKQLHELGLLERLSGGAVSALIHQRIQHHIEHTCKGNFETPLLKQVEQWLESKVVGWLDVLYGTGAQTVSSDGPRSPSPILAHPGDDSINLDYNAVASAPTPTTSSTIALTTTGTATSQDVDTSPVAAHKGRLYHYLYTVYADIRIEQLFNIIVEYPDSEPALVDLKVCLSKTDRRAKLVTLLRSALETRLLHPGVNTADILTAYVSAIRALRVLDHTGVLLELVCEPVRKYLRSREDTVRRIVSDLTGDSGNELSDELEKGHPLVLDDSYHSDEGGNNWESWQPDPVDADPSRVSASRRSSDIISMLVNIYGSKELFVNEYRTLLADRLLAHFHSATEREIRNLELLKVRFGEQQLHYCEVMLKDVEDSRRINAHIMDRQHKDKKKKENQEMKDGEGEDKENPQPSGSLVTPEPQQENREQPQQQSPRHIPEEPGPQDQPLRTLAQPQPPAQSSESEVQPLTPTQPVENMEATTAEVEDNAEDPDTETKTSEDKEEDIPVTAMILSAQFWPTFREEKLKLPEVLQRALDKYTKAYEMLKGNRTLCWKNHLGLVDLEIELKDGRKLTLNVSPVQATIIWHFQHKSRWTVEELSGIMQMSTAGVRRKMALWQSHGLLREETPDTFVLAEDARARGGHDVIVDEDEAESAMASASDQREEELQVLWSYIVGMLTNLESLPLERIHSMLKMFMLQTPTTSEVTLPELKGYLDRKVKEQKLLYSAGVYRLPKPGS